ncbi:MAG: hypothetical protein U0230_28020 [Polyangiales bacterium]
MFSFTVAVSLHGNERSYAQSPIQSDTRSRELIDALRTVRVVASALDSFPERCSGMFDPDLSWTDQERAVECANEYSSHICANPSASGSIRESIQIVNNWLWSESPIVQGNDFAWITFQGCVARSRSLATAEIIAFTDTKLSTWSQHDGRDVIALCYSACALSTEQRQRALELAGADGWKRRVEGGLSRVARCIARDVSSFDLDDFEWCVILASSLETLLRENRQRFGDDFTGLSERASAANADAQRRRGEVRLVFDMRRSESDSTRRAASRERLEQALGSLTSEFDQIQATIARRRSAAGRLANARYSAAVNAADDLDVFWRMRLIGGIGRELHIMALAFPQEFEQLSSRYQALYDAATSAHAAASEEVDQLHELREAVQAVCSDTAQLNEVHRILSGNLSRIERMIVLESRERLQGRLATDRSQLQSYEYDFNARQDCR